MDGCTRKHSFCPVARLERQAAAHLLICSSAPLLLCSSAPLLLCSSAPLRWPLCLLSRTHGCSTTKDSSKRLSVAAVCLISKTASLPADSLLGLSARCCSRLPGQGQEPHVHRLLWCAARCGVAVPCSFCVSVCVSGDDLPPCYQTDFVAAGDADVDEAISNETFNQGIGDDDL
jgi:hypothetical protein